MSDPNDPNDPDRVNAREGEGDVEVAPQVVYPVPDGEGGTKYVYGNTDEEASYEEWAAQNGIYPGPSGDPEVDPEDPDAPLARDE